MSDIIAVKESIIEEAVYDFLLEFSEPKIEADNIIRGWQNKTTLPKESNDFTIYTLLAIDRVGTGVRTLRYENDECIETLAEYKSYDIQLDFYSDTVKNNAFKRASVIELIARTVRGVEFFKTYNIGLNYAEPIKALDFIDGTGSYVSRCITTLKLTAWVEIDFVSDHFDRVKINLKEI